MMISDKVLAQLELGDFSGDMAMLAKVLANGEIMQQVDIEEFTKELMKYEKDSDQYNEFKAEFSKKLGLEIIKIIVKNLGGLQFHLSKTAFQVASERYIIKNYRLGAKELALATDMTDRQVYKILESRKINVKSHELFLE